MITETEVAVDVPALELYVDEKEGFKLLRPSLWNKVKESETYLARVTAARYFALSRCCGTLICHSSTLDKACKSCSDFSVSHPPSISRYYHAYINRELESNCYIIY